MWSTSVPCLVPRLTPLLSLLFHLFHVIVSARICESTVRLRREKHADENNGNHVEHVERGTTTNPKGKSRRAHLALGASGAESGRAWRRAALAAQHGAKQAQMRARHARSQAHGSFLDFGGRG